MVENTNINQNGLIMNINERISLIRDKFCEGDNGMFANIIGKSEQYASNICNSGKKVGVNIQNLILEKFPDVREEWLKLGKEPMLKSELASKNYDYKGSPYFNVDFIGGFDLVLEDQTVNPEYYIDLPPYNKPDILWCNLHGKSMEPYIFSGDRIAIKEIPIPDVVYGKVYGIITRAGLRTVKWIVRSPEKGCYRLVPENKDPKFGDYQDIKFEDIFKIFLVMGAVRAF